MGDLGELLELLYGARSRYRTARGIVRYRHSNRLVQEAVRRESQRVRRRGWATQYALARAGGEEPPDLHEETVRFWWEPPDRLREEMETNAPFGSHTTVLDGELWWTYSPHWGAISNVELDEEERLHHGAGGGDRFRMLLDPSWGLSSLRFEQVVEEGDLVRVRALPREDEDRPHVPLGLHFAFGADAHELLVDRKLGVLRRLASLLEGEEIAVVELEELELDEEFPEGTFVFVPPPGEEVRSPETVHRPRATLEGAAAAAPFRVFAPPELPEGAWRLDVLFHESRERPPTPAHVGLIYHRSDGRGSLVIQQRAVAGEEEPGFPWSGYGPPELEEVERDGVPYAVARGDPERGGQNGVSFERDGTSIQLQSQELAVETLLDLAANLQAVEA